jgi:hypothetical protein
VSSAILYLAIAIIWAVVILPWWIGRESCLSGDEFTTSELDAADAGKEMAAPAA